MKQSKKGKLLSFLLCFTMLLGMFPLTSVLAEGTDDPQPPVADDGNYFIIDNTGTITGLTETGKTKAKITIPSTINGITVTNIGNYAFSGNTKIESIYIPEGVTSIGYRGFTGCTNLKYLVLPGTITSIYSGDSNSAFIGCDNIISITFGGTATAWDNLARGGLPDSTELNEDGTNTKVTCLTDEADVIFDKNTQTITALTSTGKTKTKITIPATIDGIPVTQIGNYAFSGNTKIESIYIPEGVTGIGYRGFTGCTNLKYLVLPSTITYINSQDSWNSAFVGCDNIISIIFGGTATAWDNLSRGGLPDSTALNEDGTNTKVTCLTDEADVIFDKNTQTITALTSTGRTKTKITIPSEINGIAVTKIGASAFEGNTKIESLYIPEGVTTIGRRSFLGCTNLKYLVLPSTITSINSVDSWNSAFVKCNGLISITFGGTATAWDNLSRGGLPNSTDAKVTCTGAVEDATDFNFDETTGTITGLTETGKTKIAIKIPNKINDVDVKSIGGIVSDQLESVIIPEGVERILHSGFRGCSKLKSVKIPSTVTYIAHDSSDYYAAFYGWESHLTSVVFGGNASVWDNLGHGRLGDLPDSAHLIVHSLQEESNFTFNETTGTITGLTPTGKTKLAIKIPATVNGVAVKEIDRIVSDQLESVIIPEGVEKILHSSFSRCPKLKHVQIPSTVTYIAHDSSDYYAAFYGWESHLTSVVFGGNASAWDNLGHGRLGDLPDSTHLIVHCLQISYSVHFNGNGAPGSMPDQIFVYDIAQSLTKNTFTRNGFEFSGWNTFQDGTGTAYNDEQNVVNLTGANGGVFNLYARWAKSLEVSAGTYKYTKEYDGNTDLKPATGNLSINGIINNDNVEVIATPQNDYTDSNVHDENITLDLTLNNANGRNYTYKLANTTVTVPATITPKEITPTVEVASGSSYTGNPVKPIVTVKDGDSIISSDNYTLEYSNNTNVGADTAQVKVIAIADKNYTWAEPVTVNFSIAKGDYTETAITGHKDVVENKATTYTVLINELGLPASFVNAKINAVTEKTDTDNLITEVNAADGSKITFKTASLEAGETATLNIIIESDNYNDYTVEYTINTVPKEVVTISGLTFTSREYNGNPIEPTGTLTVSDNKVPVDELEVLYEGTGETTYSSDEAPTNAGEYKVTYKVPNSNTDYAGSVVYTFSITKTAPTYTIPTDLMAVKGDTLSSIALPTGFTWVNPTDKLLVAGNVVRPAKYTPTDTNNYDVVNNINIPIYVKDTYKIEVEHGTASTGVGASVTEVEEGTVITIIAATAPDGEEFDKWEVVSGNVSLDDENSATAAFTMPDEAVHVRAIYRLQATHGTATVTFKVENGTWADGSTNPVEVSVELIDGKGTLESAKVPVGMIADTGYEGGKWNSEPDTATDAVIEDITYIYSFNVKSSGGIPGVTPETGDRSDLPLATLLMTASLGMAVALMQLSRKRKPSK